MRGLLMAFLARGLGGRETPAPAGRAFVSLHSTKTTAKKATATTV